MRHGVGVTETPTGTPPEPLTPTGAEELARSPYMLLTTYRRDGTGVPTPLWCAVEGGVLYGSTQAETGKVKRLRRDGTATVAPCTNRGTPTGAAYAAHAEVLSGEAGHHAHGLIEKRFRLAKPLYLVSRLGLRLWPGRHYEVVGVAVRPPARPS